VWACPLFATRVGPVLRASPGAQYIVSTVTGEVGNFFVVEDTIDFLIAFS
jgi:hypothetical protein